MPERRVDAAQGRNWTEAREECLMVQRLWCDLLQADHLAVAAVLGWLQYDMLTQIDDERLENRFDLGIGCQLLIFKFAQGEQHVPDHLRPLANVVR